MNASKITLVTGLWDLGRGDLTEGWSRSYEHYLEKFAELLKIEENLIIFGDAKLKEFVDAHRSPANTQFIERSLDWFKNNDYFNLIQNIRTSRDWYEQVGWLSESTQAKLEYYLFIVCIIIYHGDQIIFDITDVLYYLSYSVSLILRLCTSFDAFRQNQH